MRMPELEQADRQTLERLLQEAEALERAGSFERALEQLDLALQAAVETRAVEVVPGILRRTGNIQLRSSRREAALELFMAAFTVAHLNGNRSAAAAALNALGRAHYLGGDFPAAKTFFQRALEAAPETEEALLACVHQNLGVIGYAEGLPDRARMEWLEAQTRFVGLGQEPGVGRVCNNLGTIAAERGEWWDAGLYFDQALQHASTSGDLELEGTVRANRAALAIARGELAGARAELESAQAIFHRLGHASLPPEPLGRYRVLTAQE